MLEAKTHVAAPILALGGGMYKVQGEVSVTLEEDVGYYVRGHLSKDYSAVWLEDYSGRDRIGKRSKLAIHRLTSRSCNRHRK